MKKARAWLLRLGGVFTNRRRRRELADELESHLQMHTEDNLRAGMNPEAARRAAVLKLGGLEPTKQACSERGTIPVFENFLQDLHFAIRQLHKNLGFTTTAILMVALGMCASVAIFAFVDAALIKPLPYPNPKGLMGVYETVPMFPRSPLSYPDYLDWKRMNTVFRSLDVFQYSRFILKTSTGMEAATGTRVSDGFFRTLGVRPIIGRDFYPGEDSPKGDQAVLLSYSAWQQRYGGRPDVLGTKVSWNGEPNVVIGVLPRDFYFAPASPTEFWSALHATTDKDLRRSFHSLSGVARLKDGVSVQTANAEMKSIAKRLEELYPGDNRGQGATVLPLSEVIVGHIRPILLVLLSGAGLLLLIACVNVASLVLVRSESRRREMAVRSALGAGKVRLMSQFTTEGLVLVVAGSGLGLAFAYWTIQLLLRLIPAQMAGRDAVSTGAGFKPSSADLCGCDWARCDGAVCDHAHPASLIIEDGGRPGRRRTRLEWSWLAAFRLEACRAGTCYRDGAAHCGGFAWTELLSSAACRSRDGTGPFGNARSSGDPLRL